MTQLFQGTVSRVVTNEGRESEHEAMILTLDDGKTQYELRMTGGNAFQTNDDFDAYIGRRVGVVGEVQNGILLVPSPQAVYYMNARPSGCMTPK